MEKQNAGIRQRRIGLLIAFLFASVCAQAENYSFTSTQEYIFTETDSVFILDLKDTAPEEVTFTLPHFPKDVSFVSARKESLSQEGTRILIWLTFHSPGQPSLPPVSVRIKRREHKVSFSSFEVYENPRFVQPKLTLEFEGKSESAKKVLNVQRGKPLVFTIYVQYAVQVISLDWSVPENALFDEVERYSITDGLPRGSGFSAEKNPVIKFTWTPLELGDLLLPEIKIVATSYSGLKVDLSPEPIFVHVVKADSPSEEKTNESPYAYAFADFYEDEKVKEGVTLSETDLMTLLLLRQRERRSLPLFNSAKKERIKFESRFGISGAKTNSPSEKSLPLFYLHLIFMLVFFALALLFFFLKKKVPSISFFVLTLIFLTFNVVYGKSVFTKHALFSGGNVYTIPEYGMETGVSFPRGSRVRLVREAGNWAYVCYNDSYGWVPGDYLFFIK